MSDDAALEAARRLDAWLKGEVELSPLNLKCCVRALIARCEALSPRDETSDEQLTPSQIEALVRLADAIVGEWIDSAGDSDLFDILDGLALIEAVPGGYDPDKHGDGPYNDFLEKGDDYYQTSSWLHAAIRRVRKDTAGDPRGEANTIARGEARNDYRSGFEAAREEAARVADEEKDAADSRFFSATNDARKDREGARSYMAGRIAASIRNLKTP